MRKLTVQSLVLLLVAASALVFSSCNKDEPFVKPKLSFATSEVTVNEADQTMEIEVVIDKAFTEDITIEYTLDGDAKDKVSAGSTVAYDYEITSDYLEVEILKGETKGIIAIKLYSDFSLEDPETFEISLENVDNDNIEITHDDEMTVTIEQEDGLLVLLEWGVGVGENYTDVDMDLFLWAENDAGTLQLTNIASNRASFVSPEFFFLPTAPLEDGSYGLSCNYYEGSKDPMNFVVTFIEIIDNDDAATTEINGSYGLVNRNAWDVTSVDPLLVQTFEKVGTDFTTFSSITVPGSGSRTTTGTLPKSVIKGQYLPVVLPRVN